MTQLRSHLRKECFNKINLKNSMMIQTDQLMSMCPKKALQKTRQNLILWQVRRPCKIHIVVLNQTSGCTKHETPWMGCSPLRMQRMQPRSPLLGLHLAMAKTVGRVGSLEVDVFDWDYLTRDWIYLWNSETVKYYLKKPCVFQRKWLWTLDEKLGTKEKHRFDHV